MRKNHKHQHLQRLSAILLMALLIVPPIPATTGTATWSYRYYKEEVELTFYPWEILLYDPTPPAPGRSQVLLPNGDVAVMDDMGDGWFVLDLSNAPSGDDPEGYALDLIEAYATADDDIFAAPVFGDSVLRMGVKSVVHVGFQADVDQATVDVLLQTAGFDTILQSDWIRPNIFRSTGPMRSGVDVLSSINALALDPDVRFASVNWRYMGPGLADVLVTEPLPPVSAPPPMSTPMVPEEASVEACVLPDLPPNDPLIHASWALEQGNDLDLDAYGAWGVCSGDDVSAIAILDNGVEFDHPDMADRILPGADTTSDCNVSGDPTCDGRPKFRDCEVHGTVVAGTAVGKVGNNLGTAGIAPHLKVVPIRIGRSEPFNGVCEHTSDVDWVASGLLAALALGVRVTNLSWNYGSDPDAAMKEAYEATAEAGMMHFNSAGNSGSGFVALPGSYPEVHSISGVDANGLRMQDGSKISNIGPDVAFSGPAKLILSTDLSGPDGWSSGGAFGFGHVHVTGTSFASPMAAAIAAMVFVIRPSWTAEEVLEAMKRTALDLGDPGRDDLHGDGFIQAQATLEYARAHIFADGFEDGTTSRWSETSGVTP
jgi:hypothetical protein